MRFEEISHSIIEQARAGNRQAMEQLCLAVQPGAYAVLLSILRDGDDAADALQEVLIRLVRFLPGLRDPDQFPGWLMRTLVNQASTARRRRSANVVDMTTHNPESLETKIEPAAPAAQSPRRAAASAELATMINHAVSELPPRQRSVLVLFEMEQMSIRQVAEVLELTDGAVKFHLHEARKNLRRELTELGLSPKELIGQEATS